MVLDAQGAGHWAKECGGGGKRQDLTRGLVRLEFCLGSLIGRFSSVVLIDFHCSRYLQLTCPDHTPPHKLVQPP